MSGELYRKLRCLSIFQLLHYISALSSLFLSTSLPLSSHTQGNKVLGSKGTGTRASGSGSWSGSSDPGSGRGAVQRGNTGSNGARQGNKCRQSAPFISASICICVSVYMVVSALPSTRYSTGDPSSWCLSPWSNLPLTASSLPRPLPPLYLVAPSQCAFPGIQILMSSDLHQTGRTLSPPLLIPPNPCSPFTLPFLPSPSEPSLHLL